MPSGKAINISLKGAEGELLRISKYFLLITPICKRIARMTVMKLSVKVDRIPYTTLVAKKKKKNRQDT